MAPVTAGSRATWLRLSRQCPRTGTARRCRRDRTSPRAKRPIGAIPQGRSSRFLAPGGARRGGGSHSDADRAGAPPDRPRHDQGTRLLEFPDRPAAFARSRRARAVEPGDRLAAASRGAARGKRPERAVVQARALEDLYGVQLPPEVRPGRPAKLRHAMRLMCASRGPSRRSRAWSAICPAGSTSSPRDMSGAAVGSSARRSTAGSPRAGQGRECDPERAGPPHNLALRAPLRYARGRLAGLARGGSLFCARDRVGPWLRCRPAVAVAGRFRSGSDGCLAGMGPAWRWAGGADRVSPKSARRKPTMLVRPAAETLI